MWLLSPRRKKEITSTQRALNLNPLQELLNLEVFDSTSVVFNMPPDLDVFIYRDICFCFVGIEDKCIFESGVLELWPSCSHV